jgi:hypothetical protein
MTWRSRSTGRRRIGDGVNVAPALKVALVVLDDEYSSSVRVVG